MADNRGLSDSQAYDLTVGPDQQPPLVALTVSEDSVEIDTLVTFLVDAVDDMRVENLRADCRGRSCRAGCWRPSDDSR